MTQYRTYEYRADDDTLTLNGWRLGIGNAGRLRGFDFFATANMTLTLNHDVTGYKQSVAGVPATQSNFQGLVLSAFGVFVREDATVQIAIADGDPTNPRWDLVYMEHEYKLGVTGGVQAQYKVIQGVPNLIPVKPIIDNSIEDVVIGYLYIPANTTQLNNVGVEFVQYKPQFSDQIKGRDLVNSTINSVTGTGQLTFELKSGVSSQYQVFNFPSSQGGDLDVKLNTKHAEQGSRFDLYLKGSYNILYKTEIKIDDTVIIEIAKSLLQRINEGEICHIICVFDGTNWNITGDTQDNISPKFLPNKAYNDGEIVEGITLNELQLKAIGSVIVLNDDATIDDNIQRITFTNFEPNVGQKLRIVCNFTTPTTQYKLEFGYGPGGAGNPEDYDIDLNRFASFNGNGYPFIDIKNNRVFDFELIKAPGAGGTIKYWQLINTTAILDYIGVEGRVDSTRYSTNNVVSNLESHHQSIQSIDNRLGDFNNIAIKAAEIGEWDMSSDLFITRALPSGITFENCLNVKVTIIDNLEENKTDLTVADSTTLESIGMYSVRDNDTIALSIKSGGKYNASGYNNNSNRGYITYTYMV